MDSPTSQADERAEDQAKDILLLFYQENASQSRHYEDQRQQTAAMVILAAAVVVAGAIASTPSIAWVAGGALLALCGGFGFLVSLRSHERSRLHVERVHAVRAEISRRSPATILDLYAEATRKHRERYPVLSEKTARVHYIWQTLHIGVALLGVGLATIGGLTALGS